jgi:lysozyme family protein
MKFMRRGLAFLLLLILVWCSTSIAALRQGDRGADVSELQKALQKLGHYSGTIDGDFGSKTLSAVKAFQEKNGLTVDGIAGTKTLEALMRKSGTKISSRSGRAALLSWSEANLRFPVGSVTRIVDVLTGQSLYIKRRGGQVHADSEPLTSDDTKVLRSIYGGSWSWERRAVLVELGGEWVAGSINGMPHGQSSIANGFPGHFCLHFYGSKTHGGNRACPDHQRMILYAAGRR